MIVYLIVVAIGVLFGSFLNVLIYRLPRGESIVWPGSHCPSCQEKLKSGDLVPLFGYLFLRGRCRYCQAPISSRYPLVEALTGVLFLLVYLKALSFLPDPYWWVWGLAGGVLMAILIVSTFTDLETGLIPDRLTYPGIMLGILFSFFTVGWQSSLEGMFLFAGVLFLAAVLSRGGMGGGDVKLAAVIGTFVGLPGAFLSFVLASLLGGIWAIGLLTFTKAHGKTAIKYGPFLALAAAVAWLWGEQIIGAYLHLISF
ncbi:MAG TPA: prepilin peptidase [Syntrophomonadaceae bacterium]|nr:prepilin peptidase [Syntrophomonadaceae bacterium]